VSSVDGHLIGDSWQRGSRSDRVDAAAGMLNSIVSVPGVELARFIASRSDVTPSLASTESTEVVTTKVDNSVRSSSCSIRSRRQRRACAVFRRAFARRSCRRAGGHPARIHGDAKNTVHCFGLPKAFGSHESCGDQPRRKKPFQRQEKPELLGLQLRERRARCQPNLDLPTIPKATQRGGHNDCCD